MCVPVIRTECLIKKVIITICKISLVLCIKSLQKVSLLSPPSKKLKKLITVKVWKSTIKVDALNQMIGLNTHLDDAHVAMDRLKFVIFRIYNHVQMYRKQN